MAHECTNAGTANDSIVSNNKEGDEDVKQEEERAQPQQPESDFDVDSRMNSPISTPFEQGNLPQSDLGSLHPCCEVNYCFHSCPCCSTMIKMGFFSPFSLLVFLAGKLSNCSYSSILLICFFFRRVEGHQ